jgi:hypothetical protein
MMKFIVAVLLLALVLATKLYAHGKDALQCVRQQCSTQWAACKQDQNCKPALKACRQKCRGNPNKANCWQKCLSSKNSQAAGAVAQCAQQKQCVSASASQHLL